MVQLADYDGIADTIPRHKMLNILRPPLVTVPQFLATAHASFQPGGKPGKVFLPTPITT